MPNKNDPLTKDEITDACNQFFPLFNVVLSRMPTGSTTEDALKVMETIAKLGHKKRAEKKAENDMKFGFNKNEDDSNS